VTHPDADRVEYLEGNSRRPIKAMVAGESGGVWEHGMDRNGSVMAPGRSTAVLVCRKRAEYVNRMDQPEGDRSDGGSRTRW